MRISNGRTLHDWQRKEAFGLTHKDKWPDEGMPERIIETDGSRVLHKVLPRGETLHETRRRGRRCIAQCGACGKWVCAGHFGQHKRACEAID